MEGLPSPVPAFSVRILDVSFWRPSGFFAKRSLCTLEIFFTLLTACVVEWASYYGTAIWISCRSIVEVSVQAYLGAQSGVGPPEGEKNEKLFGTRWADSHDGYDISCNLKNFCAQHKSQHPYLIVFYNIHQDNMNNTSYDKWMINIEFHCYTPDAWWSRDSNH